MAVRGLRSRIDELSSALGSQEMPADQKQKLQEYQGEEAGAQQKIYELQADLKRGAEKIGETEKLAAKTEREAREKYATGVRAEYARPDYDTMVAEFRPTKTQGSDIMGLFAMVSAVAFMSGGKGRYAGEAAMKNAGSMLEGWNKGREDLFKRELQEFDKNLKTVDQHNKASEAKLKKAIELFSVDRDAAMGLVAEIKAENVGTKAQQELNQGLLTQALNTLKEARAGSEKVRNNWNTIVEKAWEEQQRDQRDFANKMIEAGRAKELLLGNDDNLYVFRNDGSITDTRGNKPPEGVKFSQFKQSSTTSKERQLVQGLKSVDAGLTELLTELEQHPEYAALGVLGFGAETSLEAKRRGLGDKGAVSWWSRYEQLQAPERHALFGSALTKTEMGSYLKYHAKPGDHPDIVKQYLYDQIDSVRSKLRGQGVDSSSSLQNASTENFFQTYEGGAPQAAPTTRQPSAPAANKPSVSNW
jgi:hypothetical protein